MNTIAVNSSILTAHQDKIFKSISVQIEEIIKIDMMWDNMLVLSGPAGSGKTYLTTKIVEYFHKNTDYTVTITAPTHKALHVLHKNLVKANLLGVNTKTIQSFLNIKLFTDYDKGVQKFRPDKNKSNKETVKTDLLIVDECSMVSKELYEYIVEAVEQERVKAVLFVGDPFQLLPVDSSQNGVFSTVKNQYKLTEIVRQAEGSYIIKLATEIRKMIETKNYVPLQNFFKHYHDESIEYFHNQENFLKDFYSKKGWMNEDRIVTSYTNKDVDAFNRMIRTHYWHSEKSVSNPTTLMKGDTLVFNSTYTINGVIKFLNGDEVKLSYAEEAYSEQMAVKYWICKTGIGMDEEQFFVIDPNSKALFNKKLDLMAKNAKFEKDREKRKKMWEAFFATCEVFADVKYIYASTIHKLQGSTHETVYIDLYGASMNTHVDLDMLYRLVYVSVTRASDNIKILVPSFRDEAISNLETMLGDLSSTYGVKF